MNSYRALYDPEQEHPDFPGLTNPDRDEFFADINVPGYWKWDK